jgi:hypothetical protein
MLSRMERNREVRKVLNEAEGAVRLRSRLGVKVRFWRRAASSAAASPLHSQNARETPPANRR